MSFRAVIQIGVRVAVAVECSDVKMHHRSAQLQAVIPNEAQRVERSAVVPLFTAAIFIFWDETALHMSECLGNTRIEGYGLHTLRKKDFIDLEQRKQLNYNLLFRCFVGVEMDDAMMER